MNKNVILFSKIKEDAIIPTKRVEDAGYDIYACFEEYSIVIPPFSNKLIPTGIASAFTDDYVFVLEERGSSGIKNMKRSAGIIDSGYRNEWMACLYNGNTKPLVITKESNLRILELLKEDYVVYFYNKAICQALLLPVPKVHVNEIPYSELVKISSERGMGLLGSSNK